MKTYRAAVIGCSRMGGFIDNEVIGYPTIVLPMSHADGFVACPRTELVACADMRTDVMAEFGRRHNVPPSAQYTDYRAMIARENLDIVSVATQPEPRTEIVIYAAEHGIKAIYAEKALAASMAEAEAMVAAVDRNGVVFNLGTNRRWASEYDDMKAFVESGEIGALKSILITNTGTLFNMGSHYIDWALRLNNDLPVAWVQATLHNADQIIEGEILRQDPAGDAILCFQNGVMAYLLATTGGADCEVVCEQGSLAAVNDGLSWLLRRPQTIDAHGHKAMLAAPFAEPARVSTTLRLIEDLVQALDTGQPTRGGTGGSGRAGDHLCFDRVAPAGRGTRSTAPGGTQSAPATQRRTEATQI